MHQHTEANRIDAPMALTMEMIESPDVVSLRQLHLCRRSLTRAKSRFVAWATMSYRSM